MTRLRGDEGSFSLMVAVLGFGFFLLLGLVIDSARVIDARGQASAYAQSAARAGAGAINPYDTDAQLLLAKLPGPDDGFPTASDRANAYCESAEQSNKNLVDCEVSCVDATHIVVRTELVVKTSVLGAIGVNEFHVYGTGVAQPAQGVEAGSSPALTTCPS